MGHPNQAWITDQSDELKASAARIYDYLLGGAHNFAVDRALAERLLALQPNVAMIARRNRAFMRRAVLFMIEQGVRQFLDLGSGIPTVGNVHEIAQQVDPQSRILYVDYDEVAAAHSQLMLEGNERADMIQADITLPDTVLDAPETKQLLNFDEPLGLLAVTIFHYVSPEQDPVRVIRHYRDRLPTGSYLAISHATYDFANESLVEAAEEMRRSAADSVFPRTRAAVLELFDGFELVEPGLVTTSQWRPDFPADAEIDLADDSLYAGVARKP